MATGFVALGPWRHGRARRALQRAHDAGLRGDFHASGEAVSGGLSAREGKHVESERRNSPFVGSRWGIEPVLTALLFCVT